MMDTFLTLFDVISSVALIAATLDLAVVTARAALAEDRRHEVMSQLLADRQDGGKEQISTDITS